MSVLRLLFYLSTLLALGYAVLSLILPKDRRVSLPEFVSLVVLLGCGAMGLLLFWLFLCGVAIRFTAILAVSASACVLLLVLMRQRRLTLPSLPRRFTRREVLLFIVAAIPFIYFSALVLAVAIGMPLYDVDSYALWCLKAKMLFFAGSANAPGFHELTISYSHLNYPLLVPFLISGVYASLGQVNPFLGKIIFPFLYFAGLLFIFSSLRWCLSRSASILLTLLFATIPVLIRWTSAGVADVPLAIFYAPSIFYLVRFISEERREYLLLSILATLFCSFIKNEGMAIAAINVVVFSIFHITRRYSMKRLIEVFVYAGGVLIPMLPWLVWSSGIPRTHENYPSRILNFLSPDNIARFKRVLEIFGSQMLNFDRWGVLWILIVAAAVLNVGAFRQRRTLAVWMLLGGQIFAYLFVFIISPWSPEFLAKMALERILLHAAPAALYIICFHLAGNIGEDGAKCDLGV